MVALDALKALWILLVFLLVFFWLPAHVLLDKRDSPRVIRVAGNWARTVLCVTILVFLLSSLKVLGALTAVLLFLGAIAFGWIRKRVGTNRTLLTSLQATAINIIREVEARAFGRFLLVRKHSSLSERQSWRFRLKAWVRIVEGRELLTACFVVALGTTFILRSEHAVRELRFDQPEQYSAVLQAREFMLNLHPAGRPFVFPAIIAATSLVSGTEPTQVTRFLTPAIDLFVVLAVGLLIQVCARFGVACVAALYCLGAAVFPPTTSQMGVAISVTEKIQSIFNSSPATTRARPEFALGFLFLLLALVFLADWHKNSRGWLPLLDFGCCLLLTAIVSQALLIVLAMAAGVLLLRPMAGLLAFVMLCYGWVACVSLSTRITLPDEIHTILPVAAAILVGCLLALVEAGLVTRASTKAETVLLAACLSVAVIWLRPQRLCGQYLEYEAAARVTQQIASRFPRQTWVVAAPVEQLAETLGLGGHEDLAAFVGKYRTRVSSPEFRFQDEREDLFIYVEKKPFQIFSREPQTVSFSVLADPTYRNYRSPGGRASLEAAALQLCESYRQYHSNADIFFEDEVLRIYHIRAQQVPDTKGGSEGASREALRCNETC